MEQRPRARLDQRVVLVQLDDGVRRPGPAGPGQVQRYVRGEQAWAEAAFEPVLWLLQVGDLADGSLAGRGLRVGVPVEVPSHQAGLVGVQHRPVQGPDLHPHHRGLEDAGLDEPVERAVRGTVNRPGQIAGMQLVAQDGVGHELRVELGGLLSRSDQLSGHHERQRAPQHHDGREARQGERPDQSGPPPEGSPERAHRFRH